MYHIRIIGIIETQNRGLGHAHFNVGTDEDLVLNLLIFYVLILIGYYLQTTVTANDVGNPVRFHVIMAIFTAQIIRPHETNSDENAVDR